MTTETIAICWHDSSVWRHWQACPARDGGLLFWGRCRSGRRWFWTVLEVGTDPMRHLDGWADTEPESVAAARAGVAELAAGRTVIASQRHGEAQARLKELNAERRRARPAGDGAETGPVEYLYGTWRDEDCREHLVRFQITRKTAKRIYYIRRRYADEDLQIGYVSREEIETKGEAINRGAGGWWAADFHLYATPPEIRPEPVEPSNNGWRQADSATKAEVRQLRAEAAAAHPDRGGSSLAFREAYARYERARQTAGRSA